MRTSKAKPVKSVVLNLSEQMNEKNSCNRRLCTRMNIILQYRSIYLHVYHTHTLTHMYIFISLVIKVLRFSRFVNVLSVQLIYTYTRMSWMCECVYTHVDWTHHLPQQLGVKVK